MKRKKEREVLLEAARQCFAYYEPTLDKRTEADAWIDAFDSIPGFVATYDIGAIIESAAWSAR